MRPQARSPLTGWKPSALAQDADRTSPATSPGISAKLGSPAWG